MYVVSLEGKECRCQVKVCRVIKGVVYDMARDGVNYFGQCTIHKASS